MPLRRFGGRTETAPMLDGTAHPGNGRMAERAAWTPQNLMTEGVVCRKVHTCVCATCHTRMRPSVRL